MTSVKELAKKFNGPAPQLASHRGLGSVPVVKSVTQSEETQARTKTVQQHATKQVSPEAQVNAGSVPVKIVTKESTSESDRGLTVLSLLRYLSGIISDKRKR